MRQLREVPSHRILAIPGMATRLRHALAIAGVPPDAVETTIQMTPEAIEIRLVQAAGAAEVTLDQLAVIAAALRATEVTHRAILARVA
jgi:hypothetical protein